MWTSPKFGSGEAALAGGLTVATVTVELAFREVGEAFREGPIPFEVDARDYLRARSRAGRARADDVSDVSWYALQAAPLVDSLVVPLLFDRGNTEVALQLMLINWQSFAFTAFFTRLAHRTVGRARPTLVGCDDDARYSDEICGSGKTGIAQQSFISGHTAGAFTGAALFCSHHVALPLYGNLLADRAGCVIAIGGAATTGILRVVADKHWATDVFAGAVIGIVSGIGLPYLFHYRFLRLGDGTSSRITFAPTTTGDGIGIASAGFF